MKKVLLSFIAIFVFVQMFGQGNKEVKPVYKEVSGLEVIQTVYPSAVAVEKVNNVWFKIVDSGKKILGYTLSSKPYSEGIKGYHNTTPVIIVLDPQKVIQKIALLSNWETAGYIRKLEKQNYFNSWNGLKFNEAASKKASADSYTGATISANAITKNIEIVLKKAAENKI